MRHRDQSQDSVSQASPIPARPTAAHAQAGPTADTEDSRPSTGVTLAELMDTGRPKTGKHRAPVLPMPQVPVQSFPVQNIPVQNIPEQLVPTHDTAAPTPKAPVAYVAPDIPETAVWRASHLPRVFVGSLLALAIAGTSGLGVRYAQSRGSDDFVSLMIGLGVVVILWAVLIASTPQVVRLDGSVLTVRNSGGVDSFDLADGLQDVEVVGDPRTSHWAVLLHRHNNTSVVLRRHDVKASEVDPIVRHFRTVANRRGADRQTRFSR